MKDNIMKLKAKWNWDKKLSLTTDEEIRAFQSSNGFLIPGDLANYFKLVNGTDGYDDSFFRFYSLNSFRLFDKKSLFLFADYQIELFSYVIMLHENKIDDNQIYIFCGKVCKPLCNSFTEFVDLCLEDSQRLFFND